MMKTRKFLNKAKNVMISEPKICGRNIDIHIHSGTLSISLGRKLVDPNLDSLR